MEVTNQIKFDIDKSSKRMDEILDSGNGNYSDSEVIPSRSELTYTNGFYVYVTALFIDIVGSSDMTDEHKRPVLAKMYRSFISECTAILNSYDNCCEINIHGDSVWGVFSTPNNKDIDNVFSVAGKLNAIIKILNYKIKNKGYPEISIGIGLDYGRALMIKAGYSGSKLNDIIWMGDVVNSACHLSNEAGRNNMNPILMTEAIYEKLCEKKKELVKCVFLGEKKVFGGNYLNSEMNEWYKENCN